VLNYHDRGINTIIHGVWGNGCTMYDSQVMQQLMGAKSCPNQFQAKWLEWTIDEADRQGMQVHAYFEKGIKIDKNSPIFDRAVANKWLVPGIDRTYDRVEHYVLDVEVPAVANLFPKMLAEFVTKYPTIDRVFIQDYNEKNFQQELDYAVNYAGVAITDNQLHRLKAVVVNPKIKGILIFPLGGKPQVIAAQVQKIVRDDPAMSTPLPNRTVK
jgi:uncharacterized lipoprotein YddW (UPF0748 family)